MQTLKSSPFGNRTAKYCQNCGELIFKYFIVGENLSEEKACKEIDIELKCNRRGCGRFNFVKIAI